MFSISTLIHPRSVCVKLQNKSYGMACFLLSLCLCVPVGGQDILRERPKAWDHLVKGGKFLDLFDSITPIGKARSDVWGAPGVLPRYVDNGIEDSIWSYWGGNIIKSDEGNYHLFVCRWLESSEKGHREWSRSVVVRAVAPHPQGPYRVVQSIGQGHNPEIFRLKDGRYVLYVIDAYYISPTLEGPWEKKHFEFDARQRPIIEGLSNLTFTQREDGSILMICRGGGVWISQTGVSPYKQISNHSVYPPFDGRYEDPVVWKDQHQYHLIVNDWYGRIAYHLRSKEGVNWVLDPGEAYMPGIAVYQDGLVEHWYKYERIKIFQDEQKRVLQVNFAVIDTLKLEDKKSDRHSSKNIAIPIKKERLLKVVKKNGSILQLRITKEFPANDIEMNSLRLGASSVVDYGGGAPLDTYTETDKDILVTFKSKTIPLTDQDFVVKMIGKTKTGSLVYGYARLPKVNYTPAILSAADLRLVSNQLAMTIENFGLQSSKPLTLHIELREKEGIPPTQTTVRIPAIKPYEQQTLSVPLPQNPTSQNPKIKITCKDIPNALPLFEGNLRF